MKNREKRRGVLQTFFQEVEERMRNVGKSTVGAVKRWGSEDFVKTVGSWIPVVNSKNAGC